MSDFSFMKSGLGTSPTQSSQLESHFETKIVSLTLHLIEKSMETAVYYAHKAGRKVATEVDLLYAIKYESSVFLDDEGSDERIRDLHNQLLACDGSHVDLGEHAHGGSANDSDSESDSSDSESAVSGSTDSSDSPLEDPQEEPFTEATCDEEKIREINRINKEWPEYEPTDPIKLALKHSIDKMIQRIEEDGLKTVEMVIEM